MSLPVVYRGKGRELSAYVPADALPAEIAALVDYADGVWINGKEHYHTVDIHAAMSGDWATQ